MLALLLACAPTPASTTMVEAPSNWMYADTDGSIAGVRVSGGLRFHTTGDGLVSEPVPARWIDLLACGTAAPATLVFEHGALTAVHTDASCVEDRAWDVAWGWLAAGDGLLADTRHAILTLDVPAEAQCSSSC